MKITIVVLVCFVFVENLSASPDDDFEIADKTYLVKLEKILRLFNHINQPSNYTDFIEISNNFKFKDNWDQWTKPDYAKLFWKYHQNNLLLPKEEPFTITNKKHIKQAIALYKTFYYAKDFETFYKIAIWARQNLNSGLFLYSVSVAIVNGPWTSQLEIPAIYEIVPDLFFDEATKSNKISYFTDDIGINSNYYYQQIFMPYWMKNAYKTDHTNMRGEWFYFTNQQRIARYYLETLSPIPNPSINSTQINDYERRIRDVIDLGFIQTPEGMLDLYEDGKFGMLGNLIEGNADSINNRYYGNFLNQFNQLESSLRNPMFWQLYNRMMSYFYQYQKHKGPYDIEELLFKGVKIEDVSIDRLETYFDKFEVDLNNVFEAKKLQIQRLNHKIFNYTIKVTSEDKVAAFIKILIGPSNNIEDNRINFFEIDRFQYNLTNGLNEVNRSSHDSRYFSNDRVSHQELYKQVTNSIKTGDEFKLYDDMTYFGFPDRLMLPKGDAAGKQFQFFVVVAPFHNDAEFTDFAHYQIDPKYSMGYPLDRPIEFRSDFLVSNFYLKDVKIYHEDADN